MTPSMDPGSQPPVRRGRVEIERELCKGCGFCIEFCPRKVLAPDSGFNAKGYHPPVAVNPEDCVGCNLCGLYCPDFAIFGHGETMSAGADDADASAGASASESDGGEP